MPESPEKHSHDFRAGDLFWAAAIGAGVLTIYARTMVPGLGGSGDSAKFQYIGSVLGTAHPPGYPLYIFTSFAFSQLPIGTLAHRINFMSAFFGASTSALLFLILRQLRAHWSVAVAAALMLGFDRFIWNESTVAEVYSLNAALTALTVLLLLRWGETGRNRDLYLAAAAFAVSLGNHLTIGAIGPALVAYVLVTRPRSVRLRTVASCSLILLAGLSQYGYIILRTHQQAPNVEAHASNLRELFDVMRAAPYTDEMFVFSARQLWSERLPQIYRLFAAEWGLVGVVLVVSGIVALVIRRSSAAILLVGGAIGVTFLTLNVDADVNGFLLPAFVMSWVVAGVGLNGWRTLASAKATPIVATMACLALPALPLVANYRLNDHHKRTYESRYMDALFPILPERSAIVREGYSLDQLLLYKLVGERAAVGRTVQLIAADRPTVERYVAQGYTIYAFPEGRAALESFGFVFDSVQLHERRVDGALADIDMLMPLSRLIRSVACLPVGNTGWREISAVADTGAILVHIDNYRPFLSEAILYVATDDAHDEAPSLISWNGAGTPATEVLTFRTRDAGHSPALQKRVASDGAPASIALQSHAVVYRLLLRVNDSGQFNHSRIAIPRHSRLVAVKVTVDLNNPQRATVCAGPAT